MSAPHLRVHTYEAQAAVTLAAGDLSVTVLPSLGLLGASLRRGDDEYLSLHTGVDGYAAGHTTGLPLLAPWANRLSGDEYRVGALTVDLGGAPRVHRDVNRLPMHGTLGADTGWEIVRLATDVRSAVMVSRLDVGSRPDLLESFPFPHELTVEHRLDHTALSVVTTLRATGRRRVPVSFGWHPYFRLPGARRAALRVVLPARRHLELDERGIPTGVGTRAAAEEFPLGGRALDDLYALGRDRRVGLSAGERSLRLLLDRNYGFLQVYAPPDHNFCCLEPMTAPTNALVSGSCPMVSPGGSFTARFRISPT
ncbi:MAG TPA: aldose 1-epimerase [Acidimicrobiales bacterium]|nr:aldose 1-epimerase [Acidimicrobiales bacterium]